MKRVCVVIATHNGAKFVEEQLESIEAAGCDGLSIVVVDDQSTDETLTLVSRFAKTMKITVYESKTNEHDVNKRIRDNFFQALSEASADYYFFCDQDDIWAKDKIAIYSEYLINWNIVYSGYELIGQMQGRIRVKDFENYNFLNLLVSNLCPGMCVAFDNKTKEYLLKNRNKIYYHDHGLFLLARKFNLKVKCIDETRFNKYRQHSENNLGYKRPAKSRVVIQWFKRILLNTKIYLELK